eukprot:scaffold4118_cov257-Pinguiococcus_pyrenoidosus.AAC.4
MAATSPGRQKSFRGSILLARILTGLLEHENRRIGHTQRPERSAPRVSGATQEQRAGVGIGIRHLARKEKTESTKQKAEGRRQKAEGSKQKAESR